MSDSKYAVFQSGGKQYQAEVNGSFLIDKIEAGEGEKVEFNDVLLSVDGGKSSIGAPYIKNAKVVAEVVKQVKGPKIDAMNYKAKKNQRKRWGHRQDYTQIKVVELVGGK